MRRVDAADPEDRRVLRHAADRLAAQPGLDRTSTRRSSQLTQLSAEVVADRFALDRLVVLDRAGRERAGRAQRRPRRRRHEHGRRRCARSPAQRSALAGHARARARRSCARAPAVLGDVNFTLRVLNPALTDLQPVAPRLATLLRKVVPVAQNAIPTIAGVQALVPSAEAALRALPPVERKATPAVNSLTTALKPTHPDPRGAAALHARRRGRLLQRRRRRERRRLRRQRPLPQGDRSRCRPAATRSPGCSTSSDRCSASRSARFGVERRATVCSRPCPGGGSPPAADNSNPWTNPDVPPGDRQPLQPGGRPAAMRRLAVIVIVLALAGRRPARGSAARVEAQGSLDVALRRDLRRRPRACRRPAGEGRRRPRRDDRERHRHPRLQGADRGDDR